MQFVRPTFFDDDLAHGCQLAAIGLSLRVLKGLYDNGLSALIANYFGEGHTVIDMHIFYDQDELRKQTDVFSGKVATSVCFRPV